MSSIQSMAELRRKHVPANEIVSCEAISLPVSAQRGFGVDWLPAEIEVLKRKDLAPADMVALLPGRTARAIYLKRHRLGLTEHYRPRRVGRVDRGRPANPAIAASEGGSR
jgi:hypothetical protein